MCPGIGLEFVRLLQSQGCSVVIGDLQFPDEVKEIANKSGAKVLFKKTDVSVWTELADLFSFTERELGAPDIVALSAGMSYTLGSGELNANNILQGIFEPVSSYVLERGNSINARGSLGPASGTTRNLKVTKLCRSIVNTQ
jgi:NAD(P)-dependent dehydrogenase (short-subunit alcohol dehydrogenase family)